MEQWDNDHWWISTRRFEPGDPSYDLSDPDSLPLEMKFFIPIASVLDMSPEAQDYEYAKLAEIFDWHVENMRGEWYLATGTLNVDDEKTKDVMVVAWLNFALADDAMLSRMRWLDMRSEKHADLGGLSRSPR